MPFSSFPTVTRRVSVVKLIGTKHKMKIVLILISTIAVSSSAILFPEINEYKVSSDQTNRLGIIKDSISKYLSKPSDNEEDKLEPRNMIKIKDFGIDNPLKICKGKKVATIQIFQKETINNQEKVQPKKLHKTYNFYAKRIYRNRNNNLEKNESIESKIRNSEIASPVKIKKTKYSTEEKQDRREFIFMKNKNSGVNDSKNWRQKRSSNIIEEENYFTTVSALKYTGRDTRLTNDLYFKNINQ